MTTTAKLNLSIQVEAEESLTARTESLGQCFNQHPPYPPLTRSAATFRELGPPDLCHVVKSTGRSGQRDVSSVPQTTMLRIRLTLLSPFSLAHITTSLA